MNQLADITAGFRDPVRGAQQAFRTVLDVLSRPGTVQAWPDAALDGVDPPDGLPLGAAAVLLSLLDAETSLHLVHGTPASASYLRFHTGARLAGRGDAAFVSVRGADLMPDVWEALALGTDEVPQGGATVVIEVDALDTGRGLVLQGPGIESTAALHVASVPPAFWAWRQALEVERPRGVDLLFVHGRHVAAMPRSTRISLET